MKYRFILMIICLIIITSCSKSEIEISEGAPKGKLDLQQVELISNKMKISIPNDFVIMSDEMANIKYPNGNRPKQIYTNDDGSINVAFNYTSTVIEENQLNEYLKDMIRTFENLYPSATWYESKVIDINNKKIGYLELLTPAIDTKIYNLIFFTEMNNQLLLITFNCTESEMSEWTQTAKEIMHSLIIK